MSEVTLHVSDQGSDTTGDGSEAAPFRTGNHALRPPSAGGPDWDAHLTLRFRRGGLYPHTDLNRGGTSVLTPCTLTAYGDLGPPPILASMHVQRGPAQNFIRIEGLHFRKVEGSRDIGIAWRANGECASISDCDIRGFARAITAQSWDDNTKDYYRNLCIAECNLGECSDAGIYAQGQDHFQMIRNVVWNIGTNMLHQGVYMNADNTSYTIQDNIFDNVSNCGIQARSGLMSVKDNIVLRCGYGIATGHNMSKKAGRGLITGNLVAYGKDRPDGAPLNCGIGVCMVDHNQGQPFLIQGNIAHSSMGGGDLGGISLGNDIATEHTNSDGETTRRMGHVICEGNWVQDWKTALRLVENTPGKMGITSNTFAGNTSLRMVNSGPWKGLGVRHFADPLTVSQIMQQNTWRDTPILLEEGGFPTPLRYPEDWRHGFDPGHALIPPKDLPDLSLAEYLNVPSADALDEFMALAREKSLRAWTYLPWCRAKVGL